MVNYYFDTFEHLKSFDVVPYQDIIDLYLKNQSLLDENKFEKLGGDNERPVNSDVEEIEDALEKVLQLRGVNFTWIKSRKEDVGLIAEEVHDAGLIEFVDYNSNNEPDALRYGNMVSLCIKAIQELSAKVETLETKVAALGG